MACVGMASIVTAYAHIIYGSMTYAVMVYIVMPYIVMASIVMAHIVMALYRYSIPPDEKATSKTLGAGPNTILRLSSSEPQAIEFLT